MGTLGSDAGNLYSGLECQVDSQCCSGVEAFTGERGWNWRKLWEKLMCFLTATLAPCKLFSSIDDICSCSDCTRANLFSKCENIWDDAEWHLLARKGCQFVTSWYSICSWGEANFNFRANLLSRTAVKAWTDKSWSLQSPSDLRVSMANRDFKYFYEDEVFRVTKKGSLQFGMVRTKDLVI